MGFASSQSRSDTDLFKGQDGHEIEIGNINMTDSNDHVDRDNFDLLKVLGQGSFGKVYNALPQPHPAPAHCYNGCRCFSFASATAMTRTRCML